MTFPQHVTPGTASVIKQQLRELNQATRPVQVALNQAQICLNRAVKLMEENYQRERQQIIAAHDDQLRL
jgi:hypothetical protein